MIAEEFHLVQSGQLTKDIHLPATHNLELIFFIAGELPRWRDHPDRPDKDSETDLTEYLCDYLNGAINDSTAWSHVQFRTETGDEARGGRKIDLAVKPRGCALIIEGRRHSLFSSLFPIECKRLPTPKESGRDEREYVFSALSSTGGIQRFKAGHHGGKHHLAAMIGYVQEDEPIVWEKRISTWIRELAKHKPSLWALDDLLGPIVTRPSGVATLRSSHRRDAGLGVIQLEHLWIRMK